MKWHTAYDPSNVRAGNDIAVLKLAETLMPMDEALLLTEALEQTALQQVTMGVVSGWGDTARLAARIR